MPRVPGQTTRRALEQSLATLSDLGMFLCSLSPRERVRVRVPRVLRTCARTLTPRPLPQGEGAMEPASTRQRGRTVTTLEQLAPRHATGLAHRARCCSTAETPAVDGYSV